MTANKQPLVGKDCVAQLFFKPVTGTKKHFGHDFDELNTKPPSNTHATNEESEIVKGYRSKN